jgi:hypothetical protein
VEIVVSGCVVTGTHGELTSTPTIKRPQGNGEKSKARCAESRIAEYLGDGFRITSESVNPIIINRVVYNGEYDAKLAIPGQFRVYVDDGRQLPVKLTIGESVMIAKTALSTQSKGAHNYRKEIIFIDIYTDVGKFRFDRSLSQIDAHG